MYNYTRKEDMEEFCEINIKSEGQTVSLALSEFLVELDRAKFMNLKVIKVVHGYGSHGKGGEIKTNLHKLLEDLKHRKKIKDYIKGEKITKKLMSGFFYDYPFLALDPDIKNYNSGITLVLV